MKNPLVYATPDETPDEVARKLIDAFLEGVPGKEDAEPEYLLYSVADALQPIVALAVVSQADLGGRSFHDTLKIAGAFLAGLGGGKRDQ